MNVEFCEDNNDIVSNTYVNTSKFSELLFGVAQKLFWQTHNL